MEDTYVSKSWAAGDKLLASDMNAISSTLDSVENAVIDVVNTSIPTINSTVDSKIATVTASIDDTNATVAQLATKVEAIDTTAIDIPQGQTITGYIDQKITDIVGAAPETLDTLGEIATAITTNSDAIEAIKSNGTDKIAAVEQSIATINDTITTAQQSITDNKNAIDKLDSDVPKYTVFSYTSDDQVTTENRKTIQLANYDSVSGVTTTGVGVNLVMVSRWDVADFGSAQVHMNLNSTDGNITINDGKTIATTDQIPTGETLVVSEPFTTEFAKYATITSVDQIKSELTSAIDQKAPAGDYALVSQIPNVSTFITADSLQPYALTATVDSQLETKADVNHTHEIGDINGLSSTVDAKADKSSVASNSGELAVVKNTLIMLESQIAQLKAPSLTPVEVSSDTPTITEVDKDVSFNGTVTDVVATITAKSVTCNDASISNGRLITSATNDVTINNLTTSGDLPKSTANAGMTVQSDQYVRITSVDWQQTGYNAIEVGLNSAPKNVLIDGIDFGAKMTNNAISIFNWYDGATITISNCHFKDVSNPLRISNRDNKHCVINLVNCSCDKWVDGQYAGMICMQDYTSGSASVAQEANQFAKITINMYNCSGPGNVAITGDAEKLYNDHVIYLYNEWEGLIGFDASRFPTINAQ